MKLFFALNQLSLLEHMYDKYGARKFLISFFYFRNMSDRIEKTFLEEEKSEDQN